MLRPIKSRKMSYIGHMSEKEYYSKWLKEREEEGKTYKMLDNIKISNITRKRNAPRHKK